MTGRNKTDDDPAQAPATSVSTADESSCAAGPSSDVSSDPYNPPNTNANNTSAPRLPRLVILQQDTSQAVGDQTADQESASDSSSGINLHEIHPDVLAPLAEQTELIRVQSVEELEQLLVGGQADAALLAAPSVLASLPASIVDQLVHRLPIGLALLNDRCEVTWRNGLLSRLAEGTDELHINIYNLLGRATDASADTNLGHRACPFEECLAGRQLSRRQFRLSSGKFCEVSVRRLEPSVPSAALICMVRDITSDVRQREKLIAIHRAGLELSHLSQDEIARMSTDERIDLLKANILQYANNILDFKNLEVRLLDPESKRMDILLTVGMDYEGEPLELLADVEGNGVTGFVAATGMSYLCDDTLRDALYLPGARDARCSITVPIVYRERIIGTFNVESPIPGKFDESDREFLEVFAREIAVALHTLELLNIQEQAGGRASVTALRDSIALPVDEIVAEAARLLDYLEAQGASLPAGFFVRGDAKNQEAPEVEKEPSAEEDDSDDIFSAPVPMRGDESPALRSGLDMPDPTGAHLRKSIGRLLESARSIKESLREATQQFTDATQSVSNPSMLEGRRVMLADSDAAIRRSAHQMLGSLGCEVYTARDGYEALRLARTIAFELVIADIRLPDLNGYNFFAKLRGQQQGIPVVLMTGFGYDPSHSLVRARQEGLNGVLYKPFRLDRLCEAIEDALDLRESRRAHRATSPSTKTKLL